MTSDIGLLTERRFVGSGAPSGDRYLSNILRDDQLLQAALAKLGLTSERLDWSAPRVNWSAFRCAVFRTTWDYFDRFGEFSAWLDQVQTLTRLCNEASIIRWNLDKHYLADLAARGIPVVPTRFVERGTAVPLRVLLAETRWPDAVIKPCVSGAARHTYRVSPDTADELDIIVERLLADESLLLQPFAPAIVDIGEDSLMVIGGRYSHTVRKVAKAGDFRVQDDYGGTAQLHQPTAAQIALAERVIHECRPRPAYGRVDMLQDGRGGWAIMELELIEPELWLRFHPPAATALAEAIAATL